MKRKFLLGALMALLFCFALALAASATTYYVDKDGTIVDSTSDEIAYKYDLTNNAVSTVWVYDKNETKIIFADDPSYTGTFKPGDWNVTLQVYHIDDTEKATSLITQIEEIVIGENTTLDGAYSTGAFNGYTSLKSVSFYGTVGVASKGGFFNACSNLCELHFYGQNIAVPSMLISSVPQTNPAKIVFHENATGTLSTGGNTLPTCGTLGGWQIIINPNIKPSNASDTRLGAQWGQITSTTGWELIMAVNPSLYTDTELEALKTSHTFCSRAGNTSTATVMQATVMSYCDAIYEGAHNEPADDGNCTTSINCTRCGHLFAQGAAEHNMSTVITYANGFDKAGIKLCDCTNDGCTVADESVEVREIITALGYSVKEDDPYAGLYTGYQIANKEAYDEYISIMGEIKYGIAVANANGIGALVSLSQDGAVTLEAEKGLLVEIEDSEYVSFNVSINGFSEKLADSLNLVISAYTIADNDANGETDLKFIQYEMTNEENAPVNGFNTVTLNRAYYNLYPEKKEENA